jgi:hypothetical protein
MTTVAQIFNSISNLNVRKSHVSSIGSFVTEVSKEVTDNKIEKVKSYLPEGTLAAKIVASNVNFTEKQLWVIAYELLKTDYKNELEQTKKEFAVTYHFGITKEKKSKKSNTVHISLVKPQTVVEEVKVEEVKVEEVKVEEVKKTVRKKAMKTTIKNFSFELVSRGKYKVTFMSFVTGKTWSTITNDIEFLDQCKDEQKVKDLNSLKRMCKN